LRLQAPASNAFRDAVRVALPALVSIRLAALSIEDDVARLSCCAA
jgi:hypothetical protein